MKTILLYTAIAATLLLTGCRSGQWHEYRLFCGQSFDNGAQTISPEEWERFCDQVVAPEFREGFTVADADGRWLQNGSVPIREKTKIILILAPDGERARLAVGRIAARFCELFRQESVLVVRREVDVEFQSAASPSCKY